jgi:hypothetical protein
MKRILEFALQMDWLGILLSVGVVVVLLGQKDITINIY